MDEYEELNSFRCHHSYLVLGLKNNSVQYRKMQYLYFLQYILNFSQVCLGPGNTVTWKDTALPGGANEIQCDKCFQRYKHKELEKFCIGWQLIQSWGF